MNPRDWLCICGERHTGTVLNEWAETAEGRKHRPVSLWEARMAQRKEGDENEDRNHG